MKIIDDNLMNGLAEEAKKSPRLRKNYKSVSLSSYSGGASGGGGQPGGGGGPGGH